MSVRCRQDLALRQLESVGPTSLVPKQAQCRRLRLRPCPETAPRSDRHRDTWLLQMG